MKALLDRIMRGLGYVPAPVVGEAKGMADERRLAAFAEQGQMFDAIDSLLAESIEGTNDVGQTPQVARDHGLVAYYSGGSAHLVNFRVALWSWRQRARAAAEA